jgi:hypothetical protein
MIEIPFCAEKLRFRHPALLKTTPRQAEKKRETSYKQH